MKLQQIFDKQKEFNLSVGVDTDSMLENDRQEWILNLTRAMSQEIAELVDCVEWKWWSKYQEFDKQNAMVEVVDILHFLVSTAQVLGMSADDLHRMYMQKNKINHQRQADGYTTKTDDCRGMK